jgi:hypothetical protein
MVDDVVVAGAMDVVVVVAPSVVVVDDAGEVVVVLAPGMVDDVVVAGAMDVVVVVAPSVVVVDDAGEVVVVAASVVVVVDGDGAVVVVVVGWCVVDVVVLGLAVVEVVVVGACVDVVVGWCVVDVVVVGACVVVVVVGAGPQPALKMRTLQLACSFPAATKSFVTCAAQLTYAPWFRAGQHCARVAARASGTPVPLQAAPSLGVAPAARRHTVPVRTKTIRTTIGSSSGYSANRRGSGGRRISLVEAVRAFPGDAPRLPCRGGALLPLRAERTQAIRGIFGRRLTGSYEGARRHRMCVVGRIEQETVVLGRRAGRRRDGARRARGLHHAARRTPASSRGTIRSVRLSGTSSFPRRADRI